MTSPRAIRTGSWLGRKADSKDTAAPGVFAGLFGAWLGVAAAGCLLVGLAVTAAGIAAKAAEQRLNFRGEIDCTELIEPRDRYRNFDDLIGKAHHDLGLTVRHGNDIAAGIHGRHMRVTADVLRLASGIVPINIDQHLPSGKGIGEGDGRRSDADFSRGIQVREQNHPATQSDPKTHRCCHIQVGI